MSGVKKIIAIATLVVSFWVSAVLSVPVYADDTMYIGVSPMRESVVLNPGDKYKGSFIVNNPGYSEVDTPYRVEVKPFYVDEDYTPIFTNENDSGLIADWITIVSGGTGLLKPNDIKVVEFEINVPKDAPAGGQYAAIGVAVDLPHNDLEGGINIGEGMVVNHVVLAEVTGSTIIAGDILDIGVQSFMLDGAITAYSTVENTGNIHGLASYTVKVYPLFSDQALYSNEDAIETHYVLPGRKYYNESYWSETPSIGIFNVYYKVEFQGIVTEVTRMVIVCPWWLLFIIALALAILVIRIITLARLRKVNKAVF